MNYSKTPWESSDCRSTYNSVPTEGSIDIYSTPEKGEDRAWIASVHGTHVGEKDDALNIANANLMVAAPDLYEALKDLLKFVHTAPNKRSGGKLDLDGLCRSAQKAIKKAEDVSCASAE